MLAKPLYSSFTQIVSALQGHEQLLLDEVREKKQHINHEQTFFGQRKRGRGNKENHDPTFYADLGAISHMANDAGKMFHIVLTKDRQGKILVKGHKNKGLYALGEAEQQALAETTIGEILELITFPEAEAWTNKLANVGDPEEVQNLVRPTFNCETKKAAVDYDPASPTINYVNRALTEEINCESATDRNTTESTPPTLTCCDKEVANCLNKRLEHGLSIYHSFFFTWGNDDKFVGNLVQNLSMEFALKDLSKLHYFRGFLDHDPPPPLLLDHDPAPPRLLDHELSPMIFQVMTQPISRSSFEAEYRSLASTATEITLLTFLFRDIGISLQQPPQLFSDNINPLHMLVNHVFHAHSKHIEMDYDFVKEKVAVGALITRYMPTTIQVADIFTKALDKYPFIKFRSNLGVVSRPHFTLRGDDKERINFQSTDYEDSQSNDYQNIQGDNFAVCKALSRGFKESKTSITSQKS
ncbi:hypothetical protein WN943_029228 [Citrus x changshan-huyou]